MELALAITTGLLYAAGVYMMLRRSLVKIIIGVILLGNGVNLLIFLMGGIFKGKPPIIPESAKQMADISSDPLPQALILTAIVISFGLQAFAIILIKKAYKEIKTDDLDELKETDLQ